MQGDTPTGPAWEKTISPALFSMLIKSNKICPCLYRTTNYHREEVIICRQVADFKVAVKDEATVQKVMNDIKKRVHFESSPSVLNLFNGVD